MCEEVTAGGDFPSSRFPLKNPPQNQQFRPELQFAHARDPYYLQMSEKLGRNRLQIANCNLPREAQLANAWDLGPKSRFANCKWA
jgi:hypothetical protein